MAFITKPERVNPKDIIRSDTINKLIQGLGDVESYLENLFGFLTDHVEYGKVSNIPTNNNGVFAYPVSFQKEFSNSPYVFVSVENLNPKVDLAIWVNGVTTTGFTLYVKVIKRERNTYCNVNWLALL